MFVGAVFFLLGSDSQLLRSGGWVREGEGRGVGGRREGGGREGGGEGEGGEGESGGGG